MSKLSSKERKKLPAKDFAGPGRSYPVEDESHAKNAKARASEAEHEGRMSKGEEKKIDAKADKKLGGEHEKHGNEKGDHHTNDDAHSKFLHHMMP